MSRMTDEIYLRNAIPTPAWNASLAELMRAEVNVKRVGG